MGSFKDIGDSQTVNSKYSGRIIIYLESKEDYQIFAKRWFHDEGEHLEFRSSDLGDGGGCNNVVCNVEKDRTHQILSFGIVDRDALMQREKWDAFWETDDSVYKAMRPFGQHVLPLCRWEIENYLLDIDEIEILLADLGKESPRSTRQTSVVAQELCDHCDALTPIMAYNIISHQKSMAALPIKYGQEESDRQCIEANILKKIQQISSRKNYLEILSKVECFNRNGNTSEFLFYRYLRLIDGKRLFERLKAHNGLGEDYRFLLARKIKEKNKIDIELNEMIDYFKSNHIE